MAKAFRRNPSLGRPLGTGTSADMQFLIATAIPIQRRQSWRGPLARQKLILPASLARLACKILPGEIKYLLAREGFSSSNLRLIAKLSTADRYLFGNKARYYMVKRDEQADLLWYLGRLGDQATRFYFTLPS